MEDKKWTVYKHTCPNGKVYIGITSVKPEYRWSNGKGYTGSKYFNNAIKKYGWDNIDHEILFTNMNEKEAKDMERQLIAQYNSNNPQFGYNMTKGGDGTLGIKRSKEQIEYLKSVLSKSIYQRDLNGKLIKSPDEKKHSAEATREEYEQYKSQEFANILGSIAEQMDSSGPKK